MAKKQKPQGIYANKYESTPDWVVTKIKVDRFRALAWLTEQTDPMCYLEVLEGREPDEYGNLHYIAIDEYMTNRKRKEASEGIEGARQAAQPTPQPAPQPQQTPADEFDDIPF